MAQPSWSELLPMYCDLNDIDQHYVSDDIIAQLTSTSSVITYHRYGFLWYYAHQLMHGEISLDQFMTMGDVDGMLDDQINIHRYQEEHPVALGQLTPEQVAQWPSDALVVVDSLILAEYEHLYGKITTQATLIALP